MSSPIHFPGKLLYSGSRRTSHSVTLTRTPSAPVLQYSSWQWCHQIDSEV